ncbi:GerAB/ArcD/ProY family transporter [Cohnella lupini]|nr:endospore germination permease [Cohnella lupini]
MRTEEEKITGSQLGLLLFTFIVSTIILTIPGLMEMFAKQDAWLSVFPSITTGLLSIWVMTALAKRYPGMTIMQYSEKIIGKWLGKCLGFYYVYFWFMSISVMAKQHTFFIHTLLLPKSPSIVGSLTVLVLSGIAVYLGIEVIGRSTEFLTPMKMVLLLPLFFLTLRDLDPGQLKPVLAEGILPVLQGAIVPAGAFMNQMFILGWLLPYLNFPKKARKVSLLALLGISIFIFIVVLFTIMVLGPLTGKLNYSYLSVMQYIGVEGSFERLEAIAVSIWVLGSFEKIAVSLFILCLSISQLFGIRNYRDIISPVTLLAIIGSVWVFKNSSDLLAYLTFIYPSAGLITQSLIPLSLLLIDAIKRKAGRSLR